MAMTTSQMHEFAKLCLDTAGETDSTQRLCNSLTRLMALMAMGATGYLVEREMKLLLVRYEEACGELFLKSLH